MRLGKILRSLIVPMAVLVCSVTYIGCRPEISETNEIVSEPGSLISRAAQKELENILKPGSDIDSINKVFGEPVTTFEMPDGKTRLSYLFYEDVYPGIAGFVLHVTNNRVVEWFPTYSTSGGFKKTQGKIASDESETGILMEVYNPAMETKDGPTETLKLESIRYIDVTNFYTNLEGWITYSNISIILNPSDIPRVADFTGRNKSNLVRIVVGGIPTSKFLIAEPFTNEFLLVPFSRELFEETERKSMDESQFQEE